MHPSRSKASPSLKLVCFFVFLAASTLAFAAPSITSLSPTSGAVGASVTISGSGFGSTRGSSTVKFNGTTVTSYTNWSSSSIVAIVPTGATTGNVVVTVSGVNSNGKSFTVVPAPVISSLSITSGAVGASVTISGSNFGSSQGSGNVKFNGTTASITSWSASSIVTKVPSGATSGNVVVYASGVNSNGESFTVVPAPSISSLSPTSGAVGVPVTVNGSNFGSTQGSSTVKFNGTLASVTSWSATAIGTSVPSGATTGNVVVFASGVNSNGKSFTVLPSPSITSLSVTSGPPGTPVTITGTNFGSTQGSSTVQFNGTLATPTSWGSGQIATTVPWGATTGNVVVVVNSAPSNGVGFTVPTLTSISLAPQTVSLPIGATQQFTATGHFSDGSQSNISANATWTSSATNVATVSSTGVATGASEGTTTIEAAVGSINATATLTGTPSRFVLTGILNVNRDSHTATVLQNGQVLITGGQWNGTILKSCELYNPATGDFTTTGNLIYARMSHTATLLQNGEVLIVGGTTPLNGDNGFELVAELYNPATGTFSTTGSLNTGRSGQTATLLQNGQVLIAGGNDQTVELYNPSTGAFTYTGSMNTLRGDNTATLLNDGTVLVTGGGGATAELYNPTSGTFSYTGSLLVGKSYDVAVLLNNGMVLDAGGLNTQNDTDLTDAELYNPTTKTFAETGTLIVARAAATASTLSNGQALVVEGAGTLSTELYDPTSGTFSLAGNLNFSRGLQTETLLTNGTVLIAGDADVNDAELYETTPPSAPYSLQITPATANVLIGGTQTFTAVDNNGIPRTDATWTVSNPSLASIVTNGNGTGTLTGIAAGQVTITASAETTSGQEQANIVTAYSTGGVVWSVPSITGFTPTQLVQAAPIAAVSWQGVPDLYSTQLSGNGTQSILQALTADGEQLWQTNLPPANNNSVPDAFGGLIVTEYDTCFTNQANPLTVVDLDPIYGQPVWQIQAASLQGVGYCYGNGYDTPQIAVRGDGAVIVSEPTNNGFPQLTLVQANGEQTTYSVPQTILTNSQGQETYVQCCMGPPMVNIDGTAYVENEARNINANGIITSDTLNLIQINPDDTTSTTVLSSTTQNEAQLPGRIIPDGQGGILATWTISPSNPPVPQFPYQAADVVSGTVGAPYNLPFSPTTVTVGQFPTLLLGDNGAAFATDGTNSNNGPQIVSFNPVSGSVNWTYQVATQDTLSLISSSLAGGLAAKITQNGTDTVIRFASTGTSTTDLWSGTQVNYFIGNIWTGISASNTVINYSAAPVELSASDWIEPQGVGANNARQAINVTNFLTSGTNQTIAQTALQTLLTALSAPSNSACANWLQGWDYTTGTFSGTSGSSYIQGMIQNTAFGHGGFNAQIWAFTGLSNLVTGVPNGIATVFNDNSGFYKSNDGNGHNFVWPPSGFNDNDPQRPPNYPGGSLQAQLATAIHEVAHGITVDNFQSDYGVPKAGKYNNLLVYQNCNGLIQGAQ